MLATTLNANQLSYPIAKDRVRLGLKKKLTVWWLWERKVSKTKWQKNLWMYVYVEKCKQKESRDAKYIWNIKNVNKFKRIPKGVIK